MVRLSLQVEISGLERVRRATPGTALQLNCLVAGLDQAAQHTHLIWTERRLVEQEKEEEQKEQEERLVSRASLEGDHTTFLPGFTSLLVTENTEDSWRYSWRLIVENVSPHNSAVYQCQVRETR